MKKLAVVLVAMLALAAACTEQQAKTEPKEPAKLALDTKEAKTSYAIGFDIGARLKEQGLAFDPDLLSKGIKDGIGQGGAQALLTEEEVTQTLMDLQKEIMTKRQEEAKKAADENLAKGKAYLEDNKKKDGVVTLPSGLQYKVITAGAGKKPTAEDVVTVNYVGTLVDGTEFDSSYKRGQPATFPVGGVIPGWTEILQLMPAGSKYEVWIPAELAYGERQAGPVIGPNSTLHFEIELLEVKDKAAAAAEQAKPAPKPNGKPAAKPEAKPEDKAAEQPKQ